MRDYNYIDENGTYTPISKMKTSDIYDCLSVGVEIHDTDGELDPINCIIERLRLELFIRENNLRGR